jgi:hypothetical protein
VTAEPDDCDCEFDPYPPDDPDANEESYHYLRTCGGCGRQWYSLHCPHDGYQNPCSECGWRLPGTKWPFEEFSQVLSGGVFYPVPEA